MSTVRTPAHRRTIRRRSLFGAAAGAGLLGAWGVTRLATADPAEKADPQWRQHDAVGEKYTEIHEAVRRHMTENNIRAGSFSLRTKEKLVVSTGYTYAAPDYPDTQADSLFRLASVSKAFCCAAIYELSESGIIDLSEPVFPYLGIKKVALPSQSKDAGIDKITIQQLVDHTGGWDRTAADFDPVFRTRKMAQELELPGRVAKRDVAEYMYGEPLQNEPGDKEVYSNFGYLLLGLVVEQATGTEFTDFVKTDILTPLGVEDQVFCGQTLEEDALPGEVGYDAEGTGYSAWDPDSDVKVPIPYGNFLIAEMDSGGGLVATTAAMSKLSQHYASWGMGGRSAGAYRTGGMPGTASQMTSRRDSLDWSIVFNNRDGDKNWTKLADAVNAAIDEADLG
jgi:CubicO group peptidase (beta-lactamase class C family)